LKAQQQKGPPAKEGSRDQARDGGPNWLYPLNNETPNSVSRAVGWWDSEQLLILTLRVPMQPAADARL
jgi:hypothetical protein